MLGEKRKLGDAASDAVSGSRVMVDANGCCTHDSKRLCVRSLEEAHMDLIAQDDRLRVEQDMDTGLSPLPITSKQVTLPSQHRSHLVGTIPGLARPEQPRRCYRCAAGEPGHITHILQ